MPYVDPTPHFYVDVRTNEERREDALRQAAKRVEDRRAQLGRLTLRLQRATDALEDDVRHLQALANSIDAISDSGVTLNTRAIRLSSSSVGSKSALSRR